MICSLVGKNCISCLTRKHELDQCPISKEMGYFLDFFQIVKRNLHPKNMWQLLLVIFLLEKVHFLGFPDFFDISLSLKRMWQLLFITFFDSTKLICDVTWHDRWTDKFPCWNSEVGFRYFFMQWCVFMKFCAKKQW